MSTYHEALRTLRRGDEAGARALMAQAVEAGEAPAYKAYAQMCSFGQGGAQDMPSAIRCYEQAAEAGEGVAAYCLGAIHATGKGVPVDYVQARSWYRRAADLDDVDALVRLGEMEACGQGGPEDLDAAEALWRQAAERKHPEAMAWLGKRLAESERLEEAVPFLVEATLAGHEGAEQILDARRSALEALAKGGSGAAGFALGGLAMMAGQVETAALWFGPAAETGHPGAMRSLAFLLERGQGVDKDLARATLLTRRAAEGGDAVAQFNHGLNLKAKDPAASADWLAKAGEQGLAPAFLPVADLLAELERHAEALPWILRAAESGDQGGMLRALFAYRDARGCERDALQAARWCFELLVVGNGDGIHELHSFQGELSAEQLIEAATLAGDPTLADVALHAWRQEG